MATQQRNMRDSYEKTSKPVTRTNVLSTQPTGQVIRQAPAQSGYRTTQVARPTTTYANGPSVVRESNTIYSQAPSYTTQGVRQSNVYARPSAAGYGGYQTSTILGSTATRNNGQFTSTVYAPETHEVGTYNTQVDASMGLGRRKRNSYVIEIKEGETTFLEERYIGERIVNITETRGEERIISSQRPEMQTYVKEIEIWEDEPIVQERFVDKHIEVLEEKRVRVERYVDVEYEVIVERQIEKLIEKEIEIEKIMERQIQKIVEVPIERIIEIPIERIIEQPVEYERRVEVPYERIVERKVQDIIETIVYDDRYMDINYSDVHRYPNAQVLPTEVIMHEQDRIVERPVYRDNIIEHYVDVPIERIIERPVERIVEKRVERIVEQPIYYDNIIEHQVEYAIEKIIEKPVERIVERPVYIDQIRERPVAIEVIREEIREVPVEHIVEKPVYFDNIIEKVVEVLIENPYPVESVVTIPVARYVDVAVNLDEVVAKRKDIHVDRPAPVETLRRLPIEYLVRKDNPVPVETVIEVQVPEIRKDVHERIIERPVEVIRIVERAVAVEKIVEVEVERVTENAKYIEKITQRKVPFDQVIEQKYEVIRQNIIEVPVEKEIHVVVKTYSHAPVEHRNYFEKDVHVTSTVFEPVQGKEIVDQSIEVNDDEIAERTLHNKQQINQVVSENRNLKTAFGAYGTVSVKQTSTQLNSIISGNARLRSELSELESRLNIVEKDKDRLFRTSRAKFTQQIQYTVSDPKVSVLTKQLEQLVRENGALVSEVKNASKLETVVQVVEPQVQYVERPVQVQYVEPVQSYRRSNINILDEPVYTTTNQVYTTNTTPVYTTTAAPVYTTTTAAPIYTTTAAPVYTTTAAPVYTTTAAPVYTTTNSGAYYGSNSGLLHSSGYRTSYGRASNVGYTAAPVTTSYSTNPVIYNAQPTTSTKYTNGSYIVSDDHRY